MFAQKLICDVCDLLLKRQEIDSCLKRIITGDEKNFWLNYTNLLHQFGLPLDMFRFSWRTSWTSLKKKILKKILGLLNHCSYHPVVSNFCIQFFRFHFIRPLSQIRWTHNIQFYSRKRGIFRQELKLKKEETNYTFFTETVL